MKTEATQDVTVTAKLSNAAGKDTDVAISVSEAMDNETGYEVDGPEKIVVPAGKTEMSATFTVTPDDNEAYDGDAMITFTHRQRRWHGLIMPTPWCPSPW